MTTFGNYARYYDLLYRDKDYAGEVNYVSALVKRYSPDAVKLLELGSGTGRHALLLSRSGYQVTGVELSEEMLAEARGNTPEVQFHQGDLRSLNLNDKFDAVLALFHVMSYQAENKDLKSAFETAARHLKPGGLFLFDCWHGPAVLSERPEVRVKNLNDSDTEIIRIAQPELLSERNQVDVHYQVLVQADGVWEEFKEVHKMRYLFRPEIELLLEENYMELVDAEEWMTGSDPDTTTWGVVYVGRYSGNESV